VHTKVAAFRGGGSTIDRPICPGRKLLLFAEAKVKRKKDPVTRVFNYLHLSEVIVL
jgi:hypothetical protein